MNATLNTTLKILAFGDTTITSNPSLRYVDWCRDISGVSVANPRSTSHQLQVGQTLNIFNGTRATTLDGTTAFSIALLTVSPATRYRFSWTGGTNPTLRTGRALASNGKTLTWTLNANATMSVASSSALFGSIIAGDTVFVPNTTTGDAANVISVTNSGYWLVLSFTDNQHITLVRPAGQTFNGQSEVDLLTANSQFVAFSAAGVQAGDSVNISSGFNIATQMTFEVAAVTDTFFEVVSSLPLPSESGILPTATGMVFYTDTKNFLYVEADQSIVVQVNGDTGNYQRIDPVDPSVPDMPGSYMRRGPTWSLTLVNKSIQTANVTIIHAQQSE